MFYTSCCDSVHVIVVTANVLCHPYFHVISDREYAVFSFYCLSHPRKIFRRALIAYPGML